MAKRFLSAFLVVTGEEKAVETQEERQNNTAYVPLQKSAPAAVDDKFGMYFDQLCKDQ